MAFKMIYTHELVNSISLFISKLCLDRNGGFRFLTVPSVIKWSSSKNC